MMNALSRLASWSRAPYILAVIFTLGFAIRICLALSQSSVWADQALYCQEAKNILEGRWTYTNPNDNNFFALQRSGLSIYNHPLYPMLIALFSPLLGGVELAGTVLSLLANTVCIYVVYRLAKSFMDVRWALGVAALLCFSIQVVEISTSKYAESVYMMFLALGAASLRRFFQRRRLLDATLSGLMVGSAYLTKPEAIVFVPLFAGFFLLSGYRYATQTNSPRSVRAGAVFLATVFLVALPHMAYLKSVTGSWRPPQKILYNLIVAERLETMEPQRAYFELNEARTDTLLSERVSQESIGGVVRGKLGHWIARSAIHAYRILGIVLPRLWGAQRVAFLLLVGLGFFCALKSGADLRAPICLIAFLIVQMAPYSIMIFLQRPLVPLIPVLAMLSVYCLSQISSVIAGKWKWNEATLATVASTALGMIALISCMSAYPDAVNRAAFFGYPKEVGQWLGQNSDPSAVVMAPAPEIPYYAEREHVIAPARASDEDIYRYGKARRATHLVLVEYVRASSMNPAPEMASDKFVLLKEFNFQTERKPFFHLRQKILVYRLV